MGGSSCRSRGSDTGPHPCMQGNRSIVLPPQVHPCRGMGALFSARMPPFSHCLHAPCYHFLSSSTMSGAVFQHMLKPPSHRPHDNSCPPHPPAACSHPHFSYIDDRELTELQLPSLQVSSISYFFGTQGPPIQHLPVGFSPVPSTPPPLLCRWPICPAPAACWNQPCTLHPPPLLCRWPICPARPVSPS